MYGLKAWAIVGYTFDADIYCPDDIVRVINGRNIGGKSTEEALDYLAGKRGVDRMDQHSFDSGDFPKVIFASDVEGDDDRCGRCHESLIGD